MFSFALQPSIQELESCEFRLTIPEDSAVTWSQECHQAQFHSQQEDKFEYLLNIQQRT